MPAIAAVDVGSNAIRLTVIEVGPGGQARTLDQQRYALRLGSEVFTCGRLSAGTMVELQQIFIDIAVRLARHRVTRYRAVATSALRDSQNAADVVEALRVASGVTLEIIDGLEETRLMRRALLRAVGQPSSGMLLVDLGGGSLELDRMPQRRSVSLPFGTVRLLHRYPQMQKPLAADEVVALGAEIEAELRPALHRFGKVVVGVGTGGNLDALARLVPLVGRRFPAVDVTLLEQLAHDTARLTVDERCCQYGLRADRGDLVLPATLVILAVTRIVGLRTLLVPGTGLRQGLLCELDSDRTPALRARQLLVQLGIDPHQADGVCEHLRVLFYALEPVHDRWPALLTHLEIAAYLWASARVLDPRHMAIRALELLDVSDGLGLDPTERGYVATLLRDLGAGRGRDGDAVARHLWRAAHALSRGVWTPTLDVSERPPRLSIAGAHREMRGQLSPLVRALGVTLMLG